jgi:hypothetical protein
MQVYGHERENHFREKVHGKELKPLSGANSARAVKTRNFLFLPPALGIEHRPSVFSPISNMHKPHFPDTLGAVIRNVPPGQTFVPEALFFRFGLAPYLREGCIKSVPPRTSESTQTGNRTSHVVAFAYCDPSFCSQQRREWPGIPGICLSLEHLGRRSIDCSPPVSAALLNGFARNTERAAGIRRVICGRFPQREGRSNPDLSRRGLPPRRP